MHMLMLNYAAGSVTGACTCGRWRQKWEVDGPPRRVLVSVRTEYDTHVRGRAEEDPTPDIVIERSAGG